MLLLESQSRTSKLLAALVLHGESWVKGESSSERDPAAFRQGVENSGTESSFECSIVGTMVVGMVPVYCHCRSVWVRLRTVAGVKGEFYDENELDDILCM